MMPEIVEGKARPPELGPMPLATELGKTTSKCVRMSALLRSTGKVIMFDSGFLDLMILSELAERGIYALQCQEPRGGKWSASFQGDKILREITGQPFGTVRVLEGTVGSNDAPWPWLTRSTLLCSQPHVERPSRILATSPL
jgi:hypothetical protein